MWIPANELLNCDHLMSTYRLMRDVFPRRTLVGSLSDSHDSSNVQPADPAPTNKNPLFATGAPAADVASRALLDVSTRFSPPAALAMPPAADAASPAMPGDSTRYTPPAALEMPPVADAASPALLDVSTRFSPPTSLAKSPAVDRSTFPADITNTVTAPTASASASADPAQDHLGPTAMEIDDADWRPSVGAGVPDGLFAHSGARSSRDAAEPDSDGMWPISSDESDDGDELEDIEQEFGDIEAEIGYGNFELDGAELDAVNPTPGVGATGAVIGGSGVVEETIIEEGQVGPGVHHGVVKETIIEEGLVGPSVHHGVVEETIIEEGQVGPGVHHGVVEEGQVGPGVHHGVVVDPEPEITIPQPEIGSGAAPHVVPEDPSIEEGQAGSTLQRDVADKPERQVEDGVGRQDTIAEEGRAGLYLERVVIQAPEERSELALPPEETRAVSGIDVDCRGIREVEGLEERVDADREMMEVETERNEAERDNDEALKESNDGESEEVDIEGDRDSDYTHARRITRPRSSAVVVPAKRKAVKSRPTAGKNKISLTASFKSLLAQPHKTNMTYLLEQLALIKPGPTWRLPEPRKPYSGSTTWELSVSDQAWKNYQKGKRRFGGGDESDAKFVWKLMDYLDARATAAEEKTESVEAQSAEKQAMATTNAANATAAAPNDGKLPLLSLQMTSISKSSTATKSRSASSLSPIRKRARTDNGNTDHTASSSNPASTSDASLRHLADAPRQPAA
ncbi:hypothetical protein BDK51DRAFT_31772 [Blyttiomyces helicus]|uniref:Uncharacterized protein n=1 Tax=Blyttiomyces helicus TaxID=388810 RepID=A0A4P9WTI4_9FUNG|nr:hypothetical protein BDK51DRAFT_31772 [Blyttiomyces helicus]|eukprot:RKO94670.1 hypothetical protein BDK51DRAFT_31772 [Blyttiomyces helicus]